MRLVLDASVAVKLFVDESDSTRARIIVSVAKEVDAPRLLALEIASALSRKARIGEIDANDAVQGAVVASRLPLLWVEDIPLLPESVRMAQELDHPIQDCLYLALASRVGGQLLTADKRFAEKVADSRHAMHALLLGDFFKMNSDGLVHSRSL